MFGTYLKILAASHIKTHLEHCNVLLYTDAHPSDANFFLQIQKFVSSDPYTSGKTQRKSSLTTLLNMLMTSSILLTTKEMVNKKSTFSVISVFEPAQHTGRITSTSDWAYFIPKRDINKIFPDPYKLTSLTMDVLHTVCSCHPRIHTKPQTSGIRSPIQLSPVLTDNQTAVPRIGTRTCKSQSTQKRAWLDAPNPHLQTNHRLRWLNSRHRSPYQISTIPMARPKITLNHFQSLPLFKWPPACYEITRKLRCSTITLGQQLQSITPCPLRSIKPTLTRFGTFCIPTTTMSSRQRTLNDAQ